MTREDRLFQGVAFGQVDLVRQALAEGADPDCELRQGRTPLTEAILGGMGEPEVVELLLELGADPSRPDRQGWTPWLACRSRLHDRVVAEEQARILEALERAGASRVGEGVIDLWTLAGEGDLDGVRRLLDAGVRPDSPLLCALGAAVARSHLDVAALLLERGAPPEGADVEEVEVTCLMTAARRGSLEMVQLLVRHGADPARGLPDDPEWTAAHFAREKGHDAVAEWLRGRGAAEPEGLPAEARKGGPKAKFAELYRQRIDGANYDLRTDDIVEQLLAWDRRFGVQIPRVGEGRVTVQLERLPEDPEALAAEIEAFCPDVVDQGFGALPDMLEGLEEAGRPVPEDVAELVEGLDPEAEDFGRRALARWLVRHRSVELWWD